MKRPFSWAATQATFDQSEDDILSACALRFDGWQYIEMTDFDHQRALESFFQTGQWPSVALEQLAMFFTLQRGLFKWGLEYEPKHGRYWRAFRSLFLLVHSYEIPEEYRLAGYYEEWESEYRPRLAECVALVERIHATTPYHDNARPML